MYSNRLSKSRLTAFRQCPKKLWLEVHRPERKVESPDVQARYAVGHQVGAIAQQDYPQGVLIAPDNNLAQALAETPSALAQARPVFEATFQHGGVLVRADLLLPDGDGWHMAEVKSTTSAKEYHYADIAAQVWVAQACGVAIHHATVRHIDNSFVLRAEGDYAGLLTDADADAQVQDLLPTLPHTVQQARETLEGAEPAIAMGEQCKTPFECPFQAYCAKGAPPGPDYPVLLLPGIAGKTLGRALAAEGLEDLQRVPAGRIANGLLQRIHAATTSGKPYHDRAGAARAMQGWAWPRYFLDFETIAPPVPVWLGTRPYGQNPFQFSCHLAARDGSVQQRDFLDLSGHNPSRACAEALLAAIGPVGAIVAYNASFERRCIAALAAQFADLAPRLRQLEQRVVDLLPVVKQNFYHRDMRGSFSIKAVLPTLVPKLRYEDLGGVHSGSMAQLAYTEATAPGCSAARKAQLAEQLTAYCTLDSLAMVELAQALLT